MKTVKQIIITLLMAATPLLASAQVIEKAAQRLELAKVETEEGSISTSEIEVFKMNDNGTYWLSVGGLGIGTDLIQLQFDPVYELFIPLGNNLDEALNTMKELQAYYKNPRRSAMEIQGCLAALYPNDNMETVTVTSRRYLTTKLLSFSVNRDNLVRATYISKADFGSLVLSLKLYKKIHPKE